MHPTSSLHLISLGYMVTLFAVIGWGAVCWEAQLAAEAAKAPIAIAAIK